MLLAAAFTYATPVRARKALLTLTNIATNLGGVSLAFAFVALLGTNGMLTIMLDSGLGFALYPEFNLASLTGLNLVYIYHLIPFVFLVTLPAFRPFGANGSRQHLRSARPEASSGAMSAFRSFGHRSSPSSS